MASQQKQHSDRLHSLVSASGAYRWTACPGSVAMELQVPEVQTSVYAEEGTRAHELSEVMLVPLLQAGASWEQATRFATRDDYPEDMLEHVEGYVAYVMEQVERDAPKQVLIEERLCLDEDLGMFGTADVLYAHRGPNGEKFGRIIDLKFGRGVVVEAEGNSQLAYYAAALQARYGAKQPFEQIQVTIYQPRVDHEDGVARSWTLSREDIEAWAERLKASAAEAIEMSGREEGEWKLVAGKHCGFCAAKATCGAHARYVSEQAALDFTDAEIVERSDALAVTTGQLVRLDDEQVSRILTARDQIRRFLDSVEQYAITRYQNGKPIPGWKVVTSRTRRCWLKDAEEVARGLKEMGLDEGDIFDRKLKTLTGIERKLGKGGKDKLAKLVTQTVPGVKLAPADDPRPGHDASQSAANDFPDEIDPE